ncbi:MAG: tol-pal system protein YbgF [Gammaproteobacteria bacterium]|jgi:tol-pal system protein YbgF|nr:tol-pal system protein YbgF [Gammaproteobacteria bacterium]MBT4493047.1 tol-pal system protein YbgF [Gammaproteobacteria bacterium]MBT7371697.1 tol-pal system protein YbgF [Gammaproteobacteria bacterium]
MKATRALLSGVLITACSAVICTPLFVSAAESPILVESRESPAVTYRPPIEEPTASSGIEEQYQLQLLQQEVMQLRGLVEELRHELKQMKTVQDDRYLELDSRLQQALQTQALQTKVQSAEATEDQPTDEVAPPDENLSEKERYETAQILIRNRQYDMAITQLEAQILKFPDGEFTPNAYYWLGQIFAAKTNPDFEKARQALAQVISYFPDHSKVPDAAYALGKVYHTLGDCERATELLEQVVNQYEGKSAAKLAENYLRESVNCDS